ncbi:LysR substrate-binding domain-containing protein [Paraburkholderia agricolaris]|jgi:LysR family transcriptional regulator of abg operon|uniref:LysR substrate-binding domain-containing protein n=1 Tax=Paraburkholderia agricolaris TaxID=2152888 RepID=UPI0038BA7510
MKLHQLRALVACSEHRSLRETADSLSLSHPAITKSIRDLEDELGVPLIVKSPRGIELTRYGSVLCERSRQIMEDMRRASEEIEQLKGGGAGRVSIGVTATMALCVMPAVLSVLRESMPDVEVEVLELPLNGYSHRLLDGTLDFFVTHSPREIDPDCECIEIGEGHLFATVRRGHLASHIRSLVELVEFEWLFPVQIVGRPHFSAVFTDLGIPAPKKVIASQSSLLALGLVTQTDVIGLFSLPYATHPLIRDRVDVLHLDDPLPDVRTGIVRRSGVRLTPAAQHCLEAVQNVIKGLDWK